MGHGLGVLVLCVRISLSCPDSDLNGDSSKIVGKIIGYESGARSKGQRVQLVHVGARVSIGIQSGNLPISPPPLPSLLPITSSMVHKEHHPTSLTYQTYDASLSLIDERLMDVLRWPQ